MCYSCDCILIPYKNTNQSSGVIGYAAYFGKPVIGPSEGLLGRLIVNYSMGMTLGKVNEQALTGAMKEPLDRVERFYAETHNVETFVDAFIEM